MCLIALAQVVLDLAKYFEVEPMKLALRPSTICHPILDKLKTSIVIRVQCSML